MTVSVVRPDRAEGSRIMPHTPVVRLLTADEYRATMGFRPVEVGHDETPPFDFWPYFDDIPVEHLGGYDFSAGQVTSAWITRRRSFEHVLIRCDTPNVFLVLVLDLRAETVMGHHLLNLNKLYGLE
jgi:hypothetical protein